MVKPKTNQELIWDEAISLSNQLPSTMDDKFQYALKVVAEMEEMRIKLLEAEWS